MQPSSWYASGIYVVQSTKILKHLEAETYVVPRLPAKEPTLICLKLCRCLLFLPLLSLAGLPGIIAVVPVLGAQVCQAVVLGDERCFVGSWSEGRCGFGDARRGKYAIERRWGRTVVARSRPDSAAVVFVGHVEDAVYEVVTNASC
jgi:hypothetical protein